MNRQATTRRQLLRQLLAATLALGARAQARARAGVATGPYLDVHTHVGRVSNGEPPLTVTALVDWMDANHVARAAVLPLVSPESASYPGLTEQALAAARAFPDRLIPF